MKIIELPFYPVIRRYLVTNREKWRFVIQALEFQYPDSLEEQAKDWAGLVVNELIEHLESITDYIQPERGQDFIFAATRDYLIYQEDLIASVAFKVLDDNALKYEKLINIGRKEMIIYEDVKESFEFYIYHHDEIPDEYIVKNGRFFGETDRELAKIFVGNGLEYWLTDLNDAFEESYIEFHTHTTELAIFERALNNYIHDDLELFTEIYYKYIQTHFPNEK